MIPRFIQRQGAMIISLGALFVICTASVLLFKLFPPVNSVEPTTPAIVADPTDSLTTTNPEITSVPVTAVYIPTDKPTEEYPMVTATPTEVHLQPTVPEIEVLKWNIIYLCNGKNAHGVQITGGEIAGGIPPYWVTSEYLDGTHFPKKLVEETAKFQSKHIVKIDPPISVSTGRWVKVTIQSVEPDGNPIWADQLYFSPTPEECSGK